MTISGGSLGATRLPPASCRPKWSGMHAPALPPPDPRRPCRLRALLAGARVIAPFTGAGISTESGVPDFRSPGSPWMQNKPIPFQAFVASAEARREAWARKFRMDRHMAGMQPNAGHVALARLVAQGARRRSSRRTLTGCIRPPACLPIR